MLRGLDIYWFREPLGVCKGKMELPSIPLNNSVIDYTPTFTIEKQDEVVNSRKLVFEDTPDMQEFKQIVNTMTNLKIYIERSQTQQEKLQAIFT